MATRGQRRHLVSLFGQGPAVPDGDGGFTREPVALDPPQMMAEIKPATARDLERVVSNTVQANASHIVTMDYHAQVNTDTVIRFGEREFAVTGVTNPEEKNWESVLACQEVVT